MDKLQIEQLMAGEVAEWVQGHLVEDSLHGATVAASVGFESVRCVQWCLMLKQGGSWDC